MPIIAPFISLLQSIFNKVDISLSIALSKCPNGQSKEFCAGWKTTANYKTTVPEQVPKREHSILKV